MRLQQYDRFVGHMLIDVADAIQAQAEHDGLSVNILDESFKRNIDHDFRRLNVKIDGESMVTQFLVG